MNNLEKAQNIDKILMRKFHEVCKKYGITYYFDSGNLLGAVRHHDLIPWDDDIDVALTRDNFYKLLEVPKEEWGQDFELVGLKDLSPDGFFDFTLRLIYMAESIPLKSYQKVEKHVTEKYKDKMVIDIFILDNAYDSKLLQFILRLRLTALYGLCMGYRDYIDYSEYGKIKGIIIRILAFFGRLGNLDKLRKKYDKVSQSVKRRSSSYFYSNYPLELLNMCCKKEWYKDTVQLQVGDDYFDCPVGYEEILKAVYGDYMQLPPIEERVPTHIISIN